MRRSLLVLGLLVAGGVGVAPAGSAQTRIAVLMEPGTPVVATEILLSVGPADEENGQAGLANLAARSVVAPLLPVLDSLGAHLTVLPQKDALSVSVVSAPDVWMEATRLLLEALFREPADSVLTMRERGSIASELRGRSANPADVAMQEIDRAFFGTEHPWGRSTVGTPETVERLSFRAVDEFLRDNFTPDRAFASVVGPVEAPAALAHLQPLLGSTFPAPVELISFQPLRSPVRREYDSITTWIGASFLFSETADEEAVRFLAYLATADLSFSPMQRSVYNVESEVVRRIGGGEVRLQIVIPPEETEEWEERVTDVVARLVERPMPDDVFDAHLRRYEGERLMTLIAPEDRAHAAARQLLLEGSQQQIVPDLTRMTQARVRAAAAALRDPTVVVLGPTLDN
ncbi:MAG: hypothetical protein WD766_00285 [Gemmatimonadota bacterium]